MHILILNWRDITHPFAGGAEISLLEHAKYWKKRGATVVWIASMYPKAKREQELDGIRILRFGSVYSVHLWAFIENIKGRFKDFDIIIDSFHFIPYFSIFYFNKKNKIVALINEVAGTLWFSNLFFPFALIGFLLESYFLKLYKNVTFITGSDSAKRDLIAHGVHKNTIQVVNHGFSSVSIDTTLKKEKLPILIYVGRVSKDKGIEDIIEAFSYVKSKKPDVELWIVGKEEKKGLLTQIKKKYTSSMMSSVKYYGYVSEKEKFSLLKRSRVLVHASDKEGWGLNVIEANSVGTPAVGYHVPGLTDSIQHNKTGLLTIKNNPISLAEQLLYLLDNTILYKKLSKNATIWSKNFSWNSAGKKSWEIITEVYKGKTYE